MQTFALLSPYLKEVADGALGKLGDAAVGALPALWAMVRDRLVSRAPEPIRRLEAQPSDRRYRTAAEIELEEAFRDDPQWMAEVVALVEAASAARGTSQQATQVGDGNLSVQVAGDHNRVRTHQASRTP